MKYQECNKIVKQKAFERAIAGDEHKRSVVDSLDIESMSESGPGALPYPAPSTLHPRIASLCRVHCRARERGSAVAPVPVPRPLSVVFPPAFLGTQELGGVGEPLLPPWPSSPLLCQPPTPWQ